MSAPTCVRCGRPTPDGYADTGCRDRAAGQLAEIVELLPAARDVAYGLARHGDGGGVSGKPGSRLPINLGAAAKLDAAQNALTTWVRAIAEERGPAAEINAGGFSGAPEGVGTGEAGRDDLRASAEWLGGHLEWMRHRAEVGEFLADVEAAARVIRGVARGPGEQKYLGPCGAPVPQAPAGEADPPCCVATTCAPHEPPCCHHGDPTACPADPYVGDVPCEGDVYGWAGAEKGTCRTCGAQVSQAERRAWLDAEVRQYAYTVTEIAGAYPIKRNTINQWAARGRLTAHDHNEQGRARYNLGDVLDLAASDAAKREERRAAREGAGMGA